MGALVGLVLGVGLLLVWQSFTGPVGRRTDRSRGRDRVADLIAEAGIEAVASRQLLVSCAP